MYPFSYYESRLVSIRSEIEMEMEDDGWERSLLNFVVRNSPATQRMVSHRLSIVSTHACILFFFLENASCFAPALFPTMNILPSLRPRFHACNRNQGFSPYVPANMRPVFPAQISVRMKDQDSDIKIKDSDSEPRKPTSLEAAASLDLDQAESDMKLANIKDELQDINKKMMATLRRRKTLLKKYKALNQAKAEYADFVGTINTFCTAEEFDMPHAFRRLRVWSRGNARFMEEGKVLHVRTGSRFDQDSGESTYEGEGDAFIFPYGVVVCWGLDEEQELELLTVLRFCEVQGYVEPEEDHFSYTYGEGFDYVFSEDQLILTTRPSKRTEDLERSVLEKLAASHGFAQSSRLAAFAESVQQSIEDTRGLAAELAAKGDIVSQSQVRGGDGRGGEGETRLFASDAAVARSETSHEPTVGSSLTGTPSTSMRTCLTLRTCAGRTQTLTRSTGS
eukprot:751251-Hanusia_phi.AAC.2